MDFANNPSFIKQGPSPATRLFLCTTLSIALLIGDSQYNLMEKTREALSVAFYPLQWAINLPLSLARTVGGFFTAQSTLQLQNDELRNQQLAMSARLTRLETLERDYESLRKLHSLKSTKNRIGKLAEILYTGRDPFSYKIIIDKGAEAHLNPGQPVIDDQGLIGQITRVQPLTAEVTLIIDKTLMVPVILQRTGIRAILYGYGGGVEVRYLPIHADVQVGDLLMTSGIDNLYPEGLPVAKVTRVERNADAAFIRLTTVPIAGVQHGRFVMILAEKTQLPPHPANNATAGREQKSKKASAVRE